MSKQTKTTKLADRLLVEIAETPGLTAVALAERLNSTPNSVRTTLHSLRKAGHVTVSETFRNVVSTNEDGTPVFGRGRPSHGLKVTANGRKAAKRRAAAIRKLAEAEAQVEEQAEVEEQVEEQEAVTA